MNFNIPLDFRAFRLLRWSLFCLVALLFSSGVGAQGPSEAPGLSSPTGREIVLRKAALDAVVLIDDSGKTVAYLPGNWPLETMDALNDFLLQGLRDPIPAYVIQEVVATGKVVDDRIEAELRITFSTTHGRGVRIPIGLKEGILPFPLENASEPGGTRGPLDCHYEGPDRFILSTDPTDQQYVILLAPQPAADTSAGAPEGGETPTENGNEAAPSPPLPPLPRDFGMESGGEATVRQQRHIVTLSLWFPIERISDEEYRLPLSFPPAISSHFQLNVPMTDAVASVTQGTILDTVALPEGRGTQFKWLGPKSSGELTWKKKTPQLREERPVLSVDDASIVVQMEEKLTLFDATLPIQSLLGSGFDRLRIRLPRGAVLDRESTEKYATAGGYSFRVIAEENIPPAEDGTEELSIVEIQFPKRETSQVRVRLKAQRLDESEKDGFWRDLEGFDVLGAERQHGHISIMVPTEMRANWKPLRSVRRVDTLTGGMDARFEFTQPFRVQARIFQPQTRINVKPEYQVRINKGSLALTARFTYTVQGPKTDSLTVDLGDWQWTGEISPVAVVDAAGVEQSKEGVLTVPLRAATDGVFDIELKARQMISPEDTRQRLSIRLPEPTAHWTEAAPVVIVPNNNVEVIPLDEDSAVSGAAGSDITEDTPRTVGLTRRTRRSLTTRIEVPIRQQEPLTYRTEPGMDAVFVADVQYHRQKITATIRNDIRLLDAEDQVTETIAYDVAYEPVDRLFFDVPKRLEEYGRVAAYLGGKALDLRDVVASSEEAASGQYVRKLISFPETMIGKFQLTFRYSIPQIQPEHDLSTPVTIPFILPTEPQVSEHRAAVFVRPGIRIGLDADRSWKSVDASSPIGALPERNSPEIRVHSPQVREGISLLIDLADPDAMGTVVVDRAWIQTWLTGSIRRDLGTYWINSDRESITFWLPGEAQGVKVHVYRDQEPLSVSAGAMGELTVPLTEAQQKRPVLIEILYQMPFDSSGSRVELDLPHFGHESLIRSQYWEIILPQSRHVIGMPAGWMPEYQWSWGSGLFWGRVPSLDKKQVGLQSSVLSAPPVSAVANRYLFSSLHPPGHTTLYIVDRLSIVLLCSGLALVIGLVLIYFPKTRYLGSLFGLGVALAAILVYRPAPVLLALQASVFGIFLALLAGYIHRIVSREERWILPRNQTWREDSQPEEVYSVIMDDEESNPPPAP